MFSILAFAILYLLVFALLYALVLAGWLLVFGVLGVLWGAVRFGRDRIFAPKYREKAVALVQFWIAELRWQIYRLTSRKKSKNSGFRQYLDGDGELSDQLVALLNEPSPKEKRSLDDLL